MHGTTRPCDRVRRPTRRPWPAVLLVLASCAGDPALTDATAPTTTPVSPTTPVSSTTSTAPASTAPASTAPASTGAVIVDSPTTSSTSPTFPTSKFAGLGDEPVAFELSVELQAVLDASAAGDGVTATVITPQGTWSGATGFAAGDRAMTPDDQMSIASITKTLVAAQVMQLVEAGELHLDDRVADRLPPDVAFDTNGATIVDLLSMRSGYPETLADAATWETLSTDPLHSWTRQEVLATVADERAPVGQRFEYRGANYVLLGLIVEHVTGRALVEVLRGGVLAGDGYGRLIYQPDERPTEPMALPNAAPADTLESVGGYLPTLAAATATNAEGAMASDAPSLARWWRALCAGEVVSAATLDEMTDFTERPQYGLGIIDKRSDYGAGALGHTGSLLGFTTTALCFPEQGIVVVVLANGEHDVDATAGNLVRAASS
jgi:D-alanyl-D-alanine carboxypeptidase